MITDSYGQRMNPNRRLSKRTTSLSNQTRCFRRLSWKQEISEVQYSWLSWDFVLVLTMKNKMAEGLLVLRRSCLIDEFIHRPEQSMTRQSVWKMSTLEIWSGFFNFVSHSSIESKLKSLRTILNSNICLIIRYKIKNDTFVLDMPCTDELEGHGRVIKGRKIDFSKFESCQSGRWMLKMCPKGSIFWWVLQCCVHISKSPCHSNCISESAFWLQ